MSGALRPVPADMGTEASSGLTRDDLRNLLGQCLKLASENKITAKNTWGLPLIEHLEDLIKAEPETTNFQKASVTLDAGVKIYGTRVDSVHTETFKILGGLGRASGPDDLAAEGTPFARRAPGSCAVAGWEAGASGAGAAPFQRRDAQAQEVGGGVALSIGRPGAA